MLKGVFVVLATLALARAADLSGEADASASAMDAQLAQLREEVSSLQSQNDHLLADAKALGMEQLAAPAPLATAAMTAELDTAASEASAAELDAEIAAAVVDTSATDAEADAAAESGAEDQAVDAQVDIYADGNAAAQVSDDTANAVDEAAAAAPAATSLAEVDAQHKVDALVGEEKAVDAEMAGLEGELQSLMDESDSVLLANAESDAEEDVAAEEAAASGEDAEEEESETEEEETSEADEEAEVAESLDDAFAFRQVVEDASEGEEALQSAEAALPSEDRDETPSVDAAVAEEAETEDLADAVADAEAELAAEATEDEDEAEEETEAEAEEEVDEDAAADAEVDVDAELEMDEQAVESANADLDSTSLVETQTAETAQLQSLMEQEQTFRTALEAEHAEKADLDRQIAQEHYISAEAHRELAARIAEINAIITRKSGELGALENQRKAKEAALKKVDEQLLARVSKAKEIATDNAKASTLQKRVVKSIRDSMEAAKLAQKQKSDAVAAASAATAESEKARLELAALRAQMEMAQKTLFRSRLSHSFGLVEPPKPKHKKPEPKYGMYLREGEESGAEDSGQAYWRRVVARQTGKGFYEPYYERVYPQKKAAAKKCSVNKKTGKKVCKKVKKVKKQFIRPEWAPEPPKKCKKGFLGKLCRLKKKLAKLTVDLSVVPEYAPERVQPVEYVDRVPKRDARVAELLKRIAFAEKALAMYGTGAFTGPRFQQIHGEDEAEEEAEDEAEEEDAEESEEESEEEADEESEDEESDESESEEEEEESDESEAEAEEEEAEEAPAAAAPAPAAAPAAPAADVMRFAQALVQANADMQARLQAAAEHEAAATQAAEAHVEAHTETEAVAEAETETEQHTEAAAETEAHTEAAAAGAVEAEAVQNLAQLKRWGPNAVEADELTALDKLIAKMQNFRHKQHTKPMKKACLKGDAACLKTAQEADANRLKKKMAKFSLKPTIIDVRRKLLLKRLALLRKIKKAQKKANPEFLTPQYTPGPAADFVKPEYAGDKNKKIHIGLPNGWTIPKRLNKRK